MRAETDTTTEQPRPSVSTPRVNHDRAGRLRRWTAAVRNRWEGLPLAWRRALIATLALRTAVSVASFAFGALLEGLDPVSVEGVADTVFDGWTAESPRQQGYGLLGASLERFDALWYLSIAESGYPAASAGGGVPAAGAFFPLFPLVVGVLGRVLGGHLFLAASLVAMMATVAALAGIHRLIEVETGDQQLARRAVVAATVFPSAFFLLAPYTESLFLALATWALVLARRRRWFGAAGLVALAALTRNIGVLLAVPLLLEAWRQHREGHPTGARTWVAALAAAPVGLGAFLAFSWWRFDTFLGPVRAQVGWEREWTWPVESLFDAWNIATQTPGLFPSGYHTMDVLVALPVFAAVVWLLIRTPLPYGAFAAANVVVWLVYPFPGRPLMSTYRFALAVAPLFWAIAVWTRHRWAETTWVATSAALQGVMLLLFVNWYYIF